MSEEENQGKQKTIISVLKWDKVKNQSNVLNNKNPSIVDSIEQFNEDLQDVKRIMDQKIQQTNFSDDEYKTLVLVGLTGVGKSSIASYLMGHELKWYNDKYNESKIIKTPIENDPFPIGDDMTSVTKAPNIGVTDKLLICDCPGFNDTSNVQEVLNNLYLLHLFKKLKNVIFIVPLNFQQIQIGTNRQLKENIINLDKTAQFLINISNYQQENNNKFPNTIFIVNQIPNDTDQSEEALKKNVAIKFLKIADNLKNKKDIENKYIYQLAEHLQNNDIKNLFFFKRYNLKEDLIVSIDEKDKSLLDLINKQINDKQIKQLQTIKPTSQLNESGIKLIQTTMIETINDNYVKVSEKFITQLMKSFDISNELELLTNGLNYLLDFNKLLPDIEQSTLNDFFQKLRIYIEEITHAIEKDKSTTFRQIYDSYKKQTFFQNESKEYAEFLKNSQRAEQFINNISILFDKIELKNEIQILSLQLQKFIQGQIKIYNKTIMQKGLERFYKEQQDNFVKNYSEFHLEYINGLEIILPKKLESMIGYERFQILFKAYIFSRYLDSFKSDNKQIWEHYDIFLNQIANNFQGDIKKDSNQEDYSQLQDVFKHQQFQDMIVKIQSEKHKFDSIQTKVIQRLNDLLKDEQIFQSNQFNLVNIQKYSEINGKLQKIIKNFTQPLLHEVNTEIYNQLKTILQNVQDFMNIKIQELEYQILDPLLLDFSNLMNQVTFQISDIVVPNFQMEKNSNVIKKQTKQIKEMFAIYNIQYFLDEKLKKSLLKYQINIQKQYPKIQICVETCFNDSINTIGKIIEIMEESQDQENNTKYIDFIKCMEFDSFQTKIQQNNGTIQLIILKVDGFLKEEIKKQADQCKIDTLNKNYYNNIGVMQKYDLNDESNMIGNKIQPQNQEQIILQETKLKQKLRQVLDFIKIYSDGKLKLLNIQNSQQTFHKNMNQYKNLKLNETEQKNYETLQTEHNKQINEGFKSIIVKYSPQFIGQFELMIKTEFKDRLDQINNFIQNIIFDNLDSEIQLKLLTDYITLLSQISFKAESINNQQKKHKNSVHECKPLYKIYDYLDQQLRTSFFQFSEDIQKQQLVEFKISEQNSFNESISVIDTIINLAEGSQDSNITKIYIEFIKSMNFELVKTRLIDNNIQIDNIVQSIIQYVEDKQKYIYKNVQKQTNLLIKDTLTQIKSVDQEQDFSDKNIDQKLENVLQFLTTYGCDKIIFQNLQTSIENYHKTSKVIQQVVDLINQIFDKKISMINHGLECDVNVYIKVKLKNEIKGFIQQNQNQNQNNKRAIQKKPSYYEKGKQFFRQLTSSKNNEIKSNNNVIVQREFNVQECQNHKTIGDQDFQNKQFDQAQDRYINYLNTVKNIFNFGSEFDKYINFILDKQYLYQDNLYDYNKDNRYDKKNENNYQDVNPSRYLTKITEEHLNDLYELQCVLINLSVCYINTIQENSRKLSNLQPKIIKIYKMLINYLNPKYIFLLENKYIEKLQSNEQIHNKDLEKYQNRFQQFIDKLNLIQENMNNDQIFKDYNFKLQIEFAIRFMNNIQSQSKTNNNLKGLFEGVEMQNQKSQIIYQQKENDTTRKSIGMFNYPFQTQEQLDKYIKDLKEFSNLSVKDFQAKFNYKFIEPFVCFRYLLIIYGLTDSLQHTNIYTNLLIIDAEIAYSIYQNKSIYNNIRKLQKIYFEYQNGLENEKIQSCPKNLMKALNKIIIFAYDFEISINKSYLNDKYIFIKNDNLFFDQNLYIQEQCLKQLDEQQFKEGKVNWDLRYNLIIVQLKLITINNTKDNDQQIIIQKDLFSNVLNTLSYQNGYIQQLDSIIQSQGIQNSFKEIIIKILFYYIQYRIEKSDCSILIPFNMDPQDQKYLNMCPQQYINFNDEIIKKGIIYINNILLNKNVQSVNKIQIEIEQKDEVNENQGQIKKDQTQETKSSNDKNIEKLIKDFESQMMTLTERFKLQEEKLKNLEAVADLNQNNQIIKLLKKMQNNIDDPDQIIHKYYVQLFKSLNEQFISANVLSTKGIMIDKSNIYVTIITSLCQIVPLIGKPLSAISQWVGEHIVEYRIEQAAKRLTIFKSATFEENICKAAAYRLANEYHERKMKLIDQSKKQQKELKTNKPFEPPKEWTQWIENDKKIFFKQFNDNILQLEVYYNQNNEVIDEYIQIILPDNLINEQLEGPNSSSKQLSFCQKMCSCYKSNNKKQISNLDDVQERNSPLDQVKDK